jgi:hypothetical protein
MIKPHLSPKGDFYLHCWGEIYNRNLIERYFGIPGGNFWFDTFVGRKIFKKRLLEFAKNQKVCIMFNVENKQ